MLLVPKPACIMGFAFLLWPRLVPMIEKDAGMAIQVAGNENYQRTKTVITS
jgi:hypothetical protein